MTTAHARIAFILAALMLGLASVSERASADTPAGFSQAELDQMLAPIALYPDTVLSHVLIAATYPLEVVQAARWSRANPGLSGEYAVAAVEHQPWDPSVMALVAFPELLARMDADLGWTQRLGDAFLIQEYQVLDTVQYLRDEAYASGHLRSNEYVRVVRETEYIYIEPSVTRVVYVPWYDPYVVYGDWRWSAYPPVYWHQPRGYRSGLSFHWSSGHHLEYGFFFSAFHWPSHRLVVHDHHGRYKRHDKRYRKHGYGGPRFSSGRELARHEGARHWKHDPDHRRGVAYRRGIDKRHLLRASGDSGRLADSRGRGTGRNSDNDGRRDNRRDLLRERSRSSQSLSQRSAAPTADSGRRARQASERTAKSRNSIRRGTDSILGVAGKQSTRAGQRQSDARRRSASPDPQRNTSTQRRAARAHASTRRELAQRRASSLRSGNRTGSRNADALGQRARQSSLRSSSSTASRSSSRSSRQASATAPARAKSRARSLQRSSRGNRAVDSRPSPSADAPRGVKRSNRQTNSGNSPRSVRREAPRQAPSSSRGSRAETLRSRGRRGGRQ